LSDRGKAESAGLLVNRWRGEPGTHTPAHKHTDEVGREVKRAGTMQLQGTGFKAPRSSEMEVKVGSDDAARGEEREDP
jgi:hypothetical protein